MFKSGWIDCPTEWHQPQLADEFDTIRSLRTLVNKTLSSAHKAGSLRSFTEAEVAVVTDSERLYSLLQKYSESSRREEDKNYYNLSNIFIVSHSSVELCDSVSGGEWERGGWEGVTVYSGEGEVVWGGERCGVGVQVGRAEERGYHKCPRCRLWTASGKDQLCQRCTHVHTQTEEQTVFHHV